MANQPSTDKRLNGWKEIAAHLAKGVRTVQRWEQELKLPVHRIRTENGDIVWASTDEIDAWQRRLDSGKRVQGPGAFRRLAPLVICAGLGLLVLTFTCYRFRSREQPGAYRVTPDGLEVLDGRSQVLWVKRFPFALTPEPYRTLRSWDLRLVAITDVEGDGNNEVLFVTFATDAAHRQFYCFEHDGGERFRVPLEGRVRFGTQELAGPFAAKGFALGSGSGNTRDIWLVSIHHTYFPSVLRKLSPRGRATTEYWNNGHIETVVEGRVGGKRMVLLGASNNDVAMPVLIALDYDRPFGATPSVSPDHRCTSCSPGSPLHVVVLPLPEIERVTATGCVPQILAEPATDLVSFGLHCWPVLQAPQVMGSVYYTFGPDWSLVKAEFGGGYQAAHVALETQGLIRHSFHQSEAAELYDVKEWDGRRYVAIARAGAVGR